MRFEIMMQTHVTKTYSQHAMEIVTALLCVRSPQPQFVYSNQRTVTSWTDACKRKCLRIIIIHKKDKEQFLLECNKHFICMLLPFFLFSLYCIFCYIFKQTIQFHCMFMHTIFTQLVCVHGKQPQISLPQIQRKIASPSQ